jgi:hypothetical protein
MAAGALKGMCGFFVRDYLLERIEHMVDNATDISVYPRMSLAPDQRFVSRGGSSWHSSGRKTTESWLP